MSDSVILCIECEEPAVRGFHHCSKCLDRATMRLLENRDAVIYAPIRAEG